MNYDLHYIVVAQRGLPKDNAWDVYLTNDYSFKSIQEALVSHDKNDIEDSIVNSIVLGTIACVVPREEAIEIAREYADNHIITLYIEIPLI